MIGLRREVDPLQAIKDVTRWLRNAGHPQIRRERMWVAYHGTCTVATLRRPVRLRPLCFAPGEFGLDVIALVGALHHALLRRAGYDEGFVSNVARTMEYEEAYEAYRDAVEIAAPETLAQT